MKNAQDWIAHVVPAPQNFTCKDEASGQLVLSFSDTFFKRKQIGEVVISDKVHARLVVHKLATPPRTHI